MSLPELCPLDGKSGCKTRECHLYHVDWRSGEENCSIGYHVNKKPSPKTDQLYDTYVQNTSTRLGREIPTTMQIRPPVQNVAETTREETVVNRILDNPETIIEEVVTSDRNTTVIESNHASDGAAVKPADVSDNDNDKTEKKKGKSIDDAMKLDLPDDYEEEFWS
ncbi:MAG TPA: hypothetical protein C5S51_06105 [Methanosarcinaceae archaeon]|nr:hypothetical protein [Methanosarcinaceae archaeon]